MLQIWGYSIEISLIMVGAIIWTITSYRKDNGQVQIKHWSKGEEIAFTLICIMIINGTINMLGRELALYLNSAITSIALIWFGIYTKLSRKKHNKYSIYYSEGKKTYEGIIYNTLRQHDIPFTLNKAFVIINNTSSRIEFTQNGFIFTNYKSLPNHEGFFMDLECNLKNSPYKRKKKKDIYLIIFAAACTALSWVLTYSMYLHKK